jgi:hypothetical protein
MKTDLDELERLILDADEACNLTDDSRPRLQAVLDWVQAHPEHRAVIVQRFVAIVEGSAPTWEVVEYCMRELRWPEVLKATHQELERALDPATRNVRAQAVLLHLGEAFEVSIDEYYS